MNRTVSHDRGDHIEVVIYRDGEEVSRTTKAKKNLPAKEPQPGITKEWSAALKANGRREPECKHMGIEPGQQIKVSCSCNATGENNEIVYQCDVESIRRCLPHYHPNNKDRKTWSERKPESDIYQLCDACPHFKAKE